MAYVCTASSPMLLSRTPTLLWGSPQHPFHLCPHPWIYEAAQSHCINSGTLSRCLVEEKLFFRRLLRGQKEWLEVLVGTYRLVGGAHLQTGPQGGKRGQEAEVKVPEHLDPPMPEAKHYGIIQLHEPTQHAHSNPLLAYASLSCISIC